MSTQIKHKGTVIAVHEGYVTVSIEADKGDCEACAIAAVCGRGERMQIEVPTTEPFTVGQHVVLLATASTQRKAVLLLLGVPLMLLVGVVALATMCDMSTIELSLLALGTVGLWYLGMYLYRRSVGPKSAFRILRD